MAKKGERKYSTRVLIENVLTIKNGKTSHSIATSTRRGLGATRSMLVDMIKKGELRKFPRTDGKRGYKYYVICMECGTPLVYEKTSRKYVDCSNTECECYGGELTRKQVNYRLKKKGELGCCDCRKSEGGDENDENGEPMFWCSVLHEGTTNTHRCDKHEESDFSRHSHLMSVARNKKLF